METQVRPEFPVAIDSSLRSAFVECPKKFEYQYLRHLRLKGESVNLVAGGAFAKGCEATRKAFFNEGKSHEEAVTAGVLALTAEYGDFEPGVGKEGKEHPKSMRNVAEG